MVKIGNLRAQLFMAANEILSRSDGIPLLHPIFKTFQPFSIRFILFLVDSAWAAGWRLGELAAGLMWLRGGRWSPGRWQQAETGVPVAVSTWREEHLRSTGCQVGPTFLICH